MSPTLPTAARALAAALVLLLLACGGAPAGGEGGTPDAGPGGGPDGGGAAGWVLGSPAMEEVHGLVRDAQGNTTVALHVNVATTLAGQGVPAGFALAQLGTDGAVRWVRALSGLGGPRVLLALEPAGTLLVAGTFTGTIDLGAGPLTSAGGADVALARFGTDGTPQLSKRYGGAGADGVTALAALGETLHLGFVSDQPASFEGKATPLAAGSNVVELTPQGTWARAVPLEGVLHVAQDGLGRRLYTGEDGATTGGFFLVCLAADGTLAWQLDVSGSYGASAGHGLAVAADGSVVVAGTFNGRLTPVQSATSQGDDAFLLKVSPAGAVQWAKAFAGPGSDGFLSLAATASGELVVAGWSDGTALDLGGGNLMTTVNGYGQALVARFDADGRHLASRAYGGTGQEQARAVAASAQGAVAAGTFERTVDFGSGARTSAGGTDVFVLPAP